MGSVVRFPRHARASADSAAGSAASASKVICEQPRSAAKRTIAGQRWAGIKPRPRQVLTVGSGTPNASATDFVPPRSSIAESTVTDMPGTLICTLQTCQEFAECKMTFAADRAPICTMRTDISDPQFRAIVTRKMLNYPTQKAFCEDVGIDKSVWNLVEKGKRIINLSEARAIKKAHNISLDWTLDGELHKLPDDLQRKVRRALAGKEFSTTAA